MSIKIDTDTLHDLTAMAKDVHGLDQGSQAAWKDYEHLRRQSEVVKEAAVKYLSTSETTLEELYALRTIGHIINYAAQTAISRRVSPQRPEF